MTSKALMIAAASAAAIAMSGCATTLPASYHVDKDGKTSIDCKATLDCPVPMPHHWWGKLDYPDEIYVSVPSGKKVTITWTIQASDGTKFNPDGGITLKDESGKAAFKCMPAMMEHVYSCSNVIDLAPNGEYKYGIKTKGFWSGFDIDPVIKNGAS
jgi:hypothetical protein